MLRINGCSGPLILHPLFSALDKLDFGDGKVARPFVSLDRFGAIHYAAGWGKVSMWPDRPVSPLCTAAARDQLSHTHSVHCKLRTAPLSSFPPSHLRAQHHLCARTHPLPTHTRILICRGRRGWGGRYLARTITRKAGEQNATASLWGRISAGPLSLFFLLLLFLLPALSHSILISLHGSDLTPHHASHPGVHHDQCVHGLQHPCRTPDRTRTGDLQTREILVGSKGGWTQEKGKSTIVFTYLMQGHWFDVMERLHMHGYHNLI